MLKYSVFFSKAQLQDTKGKGQRLPAKEAAEEGEIGQQTVLPSLLLLALILHIPLHELSFIYPYMKHTWPRVGYEQEPLNRKLTQGSRVLSSING